MFGKYQIVQGIWYHNQLNGVVKCDSNSFQLMCFKDGMFLDMGKGQISGSFYSYIFLSFFAYGGIAASVLFEFYYTIGAAVLIYWIMCCCTSASKYINDCLEMDKVYYKLQDCIKQRPIIRWSIQCYHYETRRHTSRDANGNTKTTTRQERVNTHSASAQFNYSIWQDHSDNVDTLWFLEVLQAIRLRVYDQILFSHEAGARLSIERS